MLDKTSILILKYMNSRVENPNSPAENPSERHYTFVEDLKEIAQNLSVDEETLRAAIRFLEEQGYIKYWYKNTENRTPTHFYLDHKGLHWKEFRMQSIITYLKDKWIEFLALIVAAVSLIISVLTRLQLPPG